jgi:hypothetical protein
MHAGVYDRYFESIIEQSYGRISFAPVPVIDTAPVLLRDKGQDFAFHHAQSLQYLEGVLNISTTGLEYFMIHVHSPLFQGKSPMV